MPAEKQPANDVAQIRELIFGDKIREYDRHFTQVEQTLSELKSLLSDHGHLIEETAKKERQMQNEMNEKMDSAVADLRSSIEELRKNLEQKLQTLDEAKVNRSDLGNFFIELGMRLKGENLMGKIMEQNEDDAQG